MNKVRKRVEQIIKFLGNIEQSKRELIKELEKIQTNCSHNEGSFTVLDKNICDVCRYTINQTHDFVLYS